MPAGPDLKKKKKYFECFYLEMCWEPVNKFYIKHYLYSSSAKQN